jgi:homoserine O-succinyltransferase
MFGVFPHKVHVENHPLFKGFDDVFNVPHSRYTEVCAEDIKNHPKLTLLASSGLAGAHIVSDKSGRQIFVTGHAEYDRETLKGEYVRDINKGLDMHKPYNYYPDDDPAKEPINSWFGHASLMYSNWLNFCVYQKTPFDLTEIQPLVI